MSIDRAGRRILALIVAIAPLRWAIRSLSLRGHVPPSVWKRLPPPAGLFEVAVGDRSFAFDAAAGDVLPRRLYWRGMAGHEAETFDAIAPLMATVSQFVDVGANVGLYSLYACAANPTTTAIAFEAVDRVADLLDRNIAGSGLAGRIEVRRVAVSDTTGTVRFIIPDTAVPATARLSDAQHVAASASTTELEVPCVTLADALAGTSPDLIKIDVEGAEDIVLRGAGDLLERARPGLILEVLPEGPIEALDAILTAASYRCWALTTDGPVAIDHVRADQQRQERNILAMHRDDERTRLIDG